MQTFDLNVMEKPFRIVDGAIGFDFFEEVDVSGGGSSSNSDATCSFAQRLSAGNFPSLSLERNPTRGAHYDTRSARVARKTPPFVLEYSSYVTHMRPESVLASLESCFSSDKRIEYEVSESEFFVKGRAHVCGESVGFVINVFEEPDGQSRLQFQRNGGSCIDFHHFYKECVIAMGLPDAVKYENQGWFSMMPQSSELAESESEDLAGLMKKVDEAKNHMLIEVKHNALRSFSVYVTKHNIPENRVDSIVESLASFLYEDEEDVDLEVCRLVATICATLASQAHASMRGSTEGVKKVLEPLSRWAKTTPNVGEGKEFLARYNLLRLSQ